MYSVRCFVNPLFVFIHLKAKAINKLKQEATREKGLTSGKLHHSLLYMIRVTVSALLLVCTSYFHFMLKVGNKVHSVFFVFL